jgi:hypothetical protein
MVVFNNVLIFALFNCMRVVWSMFCLELCICHCDEYSYSLRMIHGCFL